ncbi:CoA transferase [Ramlibacter sp. G-1-2-2]|uniref:CoA transferase n=1 Tax=Ramlibacter agri TaxID=2728837 RepID=A0A848H9C7_9BURK|nr:CaiB/BaiF CoA-transferase family protein [Ramlibacter agri]NML47596.1 CoA transferase [Ramlibacter agri]
MDSTGPLAGIKVLDFGHMVMGPSCGLVLADLGAEVMRIEPPQGDPTRKLKGFGLGFFTYFNRNKSSAQLDLKQGEASQEVMRRALEWADVVIENFAPGVMARLGLGYEDVAKVNARIVYCSLKGYLPGPYQDRLALDEVAQMMGGMAYMTGPAGTPLRAGGSVVDITGGVFGAVGILAALRERERTGRGQLVESSLFESAAFYTGQHMAYFSMSGETPKPMPTRSHVFTVYDLFKTADNDVFVGVTSEQQWDRFCQEFGLAHLKADPELATQADRLKVRPRVIAAVAEVFAGLSADDIVERCAAAKLPAAKVNRPDQLLDDPHLKASGQLLPTTLPDGRTATLPALPFKMNGHNLGIRQQPQPAGRQTHGFLRALGYSDAEIAGLAQAQVIPS